MKKLIFLFIVIFQCSLYSASYLFPIAVNDKVGYIDSSGKIIIEPVYDTEVTHYNFESNGKTFGGVRFPENAYFSEGVATVKKVTYFWFIPLRHEFSCIDMEFMGLNYFYNPLNIEIGSFHDSLAVVRVPQKHFQYEYGNLYGYMKRNGKLTIILNCNYAGRFYEGKALVLINNAYGYIDKSLVDSLIPLTDSLILDPLGQIAIMPQFKDAGDFGDGLAPVKTNELFGYINDSGKFVIDEKFIGAWQFKGGLARVYDGNNFYYIRTDGNLAFNKNFKEASDFDSGFARVAESGKMGFINRKGEYVIPPKFSKLSNFSEGTAAVEFNGKWGFINRNGDFILPPKYDYALSFNHGLAAVWIDGVMVYIDRSGKTISQVSWDTKTFLWW